MFNFFNQPKKKTIAELESEKDIILYSLDWLLMMNLIDIKEYNNLLIQADDILKSRENR